MGVRCNVCASAHCLTPLLVLLFPLLLPLFCGQVIDYVVGFDDLGGKDDFSTGEHGSNCVAVVACAFHNARRVLGVDGKAGILVMAFCICCAQGVGGIIGSGEIWARLVERGVPRTKTVHLRQSVQGWGIQRACSRCRQMARCCCTGSQSHSA